MKNIVLILLALISMGAAAQETVVGEDTLLAKPGEGKAMVYLARRSSMAVLIKFKLYDGDLYLGKLGADKYFAYECDPGKHVFIGKGENTSYVEADLEEGKTYVIDLKVTMGVMSARMNLAPLDKSNKKYEKEKKKFLEFIGKKKGELISESEDDEEDETEDGDADAVEVSEQTNADGEAMSKRMKKYYKMKEEGKKITTITPDMYFDL